jgi:hypothetical protein
MKSLELIEKFAKRNAMMGMQFFLFSSATDATPMIAHKNVNSPCIIRRRIFDDQPEWCSTVDITVCLFSASIFSVPFSLTWIRTEFTKPLRWKSLKRLIALQASIGNERCGWLKRTPFATALM